MKGWLDKYKCEDGKKLDKSPDTIKKRVFDQYPVLNKVASIDSFHVDYAHGDDKKVLNKLGHNPEYIGPGEGTVDENYGNTFIPKGKMLIGDNTFVNVNHPGQYTTLIDSTGKTQQQLTDLAANDFVSHSLHKLPEYEQMTNNLNTALVKKYGKKMVEGNGGTDAYVRGIVDNSADYQPYRDEMKNIDTSYTNPIKRFVGKKENGGKIKAKPGASLGPAPTSQDSLDVYNSSVNNLKYYRDRGYKETKPVYDLSHDTFHMLDSTADDFKKANGFTTYPTSDGHTFVQDKLPLSQYRQDIDKNKFKQREISTRIIDTRAPMVQYDRRIKPSATYTFTNTNPNDPMYQDTAIIPGYDPVAVKPDALLSPEERALRNNRYGKGTPAPKPHPTENIHTLDTYGAKLLPTNIQQSNVQQIDLTEGINYAYQGNGVFVPDDFHKSIGYPNKTQYKNGGKIEKNWLENYK